MRMMFLLDQLMTRAGCKKDVVWSRFVFQWLAISLILHIIAAVRSTGFYHSSEHFQIAELIYSKLGLNNTVDLPPDYRLKIEPWLLPSIFTGASGFLRVIGITSPFDWALGYRLISSMIGWLSCCGLTLCCYLWFKQKHWRRWAVIALNMIWYLPAFHARHSPENVGGSVFFIGLSLLLLGSSTRTTPSVSESHSISRHPNQASRASPFSECDPKLALGVGFLFGLAFEFCFDTGIMIIGFLLWLLTVSRRSPLLCLNILGGSFIALGIGALADLWGYGQWTFTFGNYLHYHFIENYQDSPSSLYHLSGFLDQTLYRFWPPLGLIALLCFAMGWILKPTHVLTWCTLPLFLVYETFPQKEIRYLLPIAHVGGLFVIMAIYSVWNLLPHSTEESKIWEKIRLGRKCIERTFLGYNLVALLALSCLPAWIPIRFLDRLYHFRPYGFQVNYKDDRLLRLEGTRLNFYLPEDISFNRIQEYSDLIHLLTTKESAQWLFEPTPALPETAGPLRRWCKLEFSNLPEWLGKKLGENWTLFKCQSPGFIKTSVERHY